MKKISLIYLMVFFVMACGDDANELEEKAIISEITPFAGTDVQQVKVGSEENYPLADADFYLITYMSYKNNTLLLADLSVPTRYYLRKINTSDNTVNEVDNYTASSFSIGKVELSPNSELLYIYNYSDLYAHDLSTSSRPKLNDDEIETFALSPSGNINIFFENDDDDTYYVSNLDGSNQTKVRETARGRVTFPRTLRFFIAANGDYYYKLGSSLYKGENAIYSSFSNSIDEIVMTNNNNFFFSDLNTGDLYFLENGAEEPIHLTAPDSQFADSFDNISALAIDNEKQILYVADRTKIYSVKLNRL
jgi:hypothetical protein